MNDDAIELPAKLPEELVAQDRRALVIYYDDATNTVDLYLDEFTWLEVPELLRAALDVAEFNAPVPADLYETEDTDE